MAKKVIIGVFLLIAVFIFGNYIYARANLWKAYCIAFEKIMNEDTSMNSGMRYIYIDTNSLKGISQKDKAKVVRYFSKNYEQVVIEVPKSKLKSIGTFVSEGVMLSAERKTSIFPKLTVYCYTYGGPNAYVFGRSSMICILGKWRLLYSGTTGIS